MCIRDRPGSPFNDEKLTSSPLELLNAKYGLSDPVLVRFFRYVANMFQGDFGVSYVINKNKAVSALISGPLSLSIRIGAMAMVVGSILGLILGVAAALNHNTWVDTLCSFISIIGVSVPSYVFALVLMYYVGFKLSWTPILYSAKTVSYTHLDVYKRQPQYLGYLFSYVHQRKDVVHKTARTLPR